MTRKKNNWLFEQTIFNSSPYYITCLSWGDLTVFPWLLSNIPEEKHEVKNYEGRLWGNSPFTHLQNSEFVGILINNYIILTPVETWISPYKNKECLQVFLGEWKWEMETRSAQKPDTEAQSLQTRYFMGRVMLWKDLKREGVGMRVWLDPRTQKFFTGNSFWTSVLELSLIYQHHTSHGSNQSLRKSWQWRQWKLLE